jgi:iron-siderophore transport system ATP-binding protein
MTARLTATDLTLAYDSRTVVQGLSLQIPDGEFTVIVGPNGCGKSTLLKALSRTMRPAAGQVMLDGRPIASYRSKEVARELALLPQTPIAPDTITVRDLVARGRFPHTTLLRQWSTADERAVQSAMEETETTQLADRPVSELSGGQRQRVWLAVVLAQQTQIVLLDEPTTFLDIGYQYEVLELCSALQNSGRTFVAVLHDLNQAARFATNLIVMADGAIVASGHPNDVMTEATVSSVFGLNCRVIDDPETGSPLVVPRVRINQSGSAPSKTRQ